MIPKSGYQFSDRIMPKKSNGRGEPRPLSEIPVMMAYFAAAFGSGTGLSASVCR